MLTDLIDFWRQCPLDKPPFVHPADIATVQKMSGRSIYQMTEDFDEFVVGTRFGCFDDHEFHLSLLPVPYAGDLSNAEIVILLLNPGLSYSDYWGETKIPHFRDRLIANLRQSFEGIEFPFSGLDPQFCWYGGFTWWEKKLRGVITEIANKQFSGRYLDALRSLSTKMACVELVPYHSAFFGSHGMLKQLRSVEVIKSFARESLLLDSGSGKRTIIVTRQEKEWGLPAGVADINKNVVVYRGGHTRGASLSPNSEGGRAILRRYDIH